MNFKKYLSFIILFICVISVFLVKFTYISLGLSILTFLFSLLFYKKNIRLLLITIIISIATIVTDIMILYKQDSKVDMDIFKDTNILLGTWNYDFGNSSYIFKDNYTYTQYIGSDSNYCIGTYEYSYGGTSNDGEVITNDDNYYYYDLKLNINYCIIENKKINDNIKELFVFGVNKYDYDDLIFMDIENNYAFKVNRSKK